MQGLNGYKNFRGIKQANLFLPAHGVLSGDNNVGKTTILEALDLILGPDRLNRQPPVDEHDFFRGIYTLRPDVESVEDDADITSDRETSKRGFESICKTDRLALALGLPYAALATTANVSDRDGAVEMFSQADFQKMPTLNKILCDGGYNRRSVCRKDSRSDRCGSRNR
jgi:hypothetical protein